MECFEICVKFAQLDSLCNQVVESLPFYKRVACFMWISARISCVVHASTSRTLMGFTVVSDFLKLVHDMSIGIALVLIGSYIYQWQILHMNSIFKDHEDQWPNVSLTLEENGWVQDGLIEEVNSDLHPLSNIWYYS